MFGRNKIAMVVAEFLGTFTLAGAVLAMSGRTNFPFFSAAAAGLTMALMVLIIGQVSGAHINPAVTVGLWTQRKIATLTAIIYVAAQMLGGVVAWRVNEYLLNQPLKNLTTKNLDWRVLTAEAIGTFIFTFGVAAAVYQGYEELKRAAVIGGSLFAGVLAASFGSAGVVNPAVAIGVRSWSASYVAGPVLGAVVGMTLYAILFAPQTRKATAKVAVAKSSTKKPARRTSRKSKK